jgi:hypothetical protein
MAYNNYVKFVRGTSLAFENVINKDSDTLYFITDSDSGRGSLYLGDKLISGVANLTDLQDILVSEVSDKDLLTYDAESGKWTNKSIIEAIGLMSAATATTQGGAGLVPAPGIGQQDYFLRGDGTWAPVTAADSATSKTQVFEVTTINNNEAHETAIERIVGELSVEKGDIAIVKDLIANEKYQYTAYVYNGSKWVAMDGNYRADNVYFDEDFTFTKAIGTVTIPSSGSKKVDAKGKNLQEFFAGLFAEEEYPVVPSTSASLSSSNIGAKEVGTNIAISYTINTSANNYKYGPSSNGVSWSNYKATFNGETLTTKSGTFTTVQVTDDTSLKITGSVDQSAGAIPVTNLGNEHPAAQIKSKSWSNLEVGTLTGYRAWFCGYKNGDNALADATAITGDQVRALGTSNNGSWATSMDITKMKQMYFAAPQGVASKPSVKDAATTAPQTVLGPITVYVKGANNYVAPGDETTNGGMAYDVWYVANADAASGSATVNITW